MIITVAIDAIEAVTVGKVGITLAIAGKRVGSVIGPIGAVFVHLRGETQTPGIVLIVVCAAIEIVVNFAVVGNTVDGL